MNPVYILIFIIFLAVGILAGVFVLKDGTQPLQVIPAIINDVYAMWQALPPIVQTSLMIGIPSLLTMFFAWTKGRAMAKLNEVQTQATSQITQIEGEKQELQQQLSISSTQGLEDIIKQRDNAQTSLTTLQGTVTSQKEKINTLMAEKVTLERLLNTKYIQPEPIKPP